MRRSVCLSLLLVIALAATVSAQGGGTSSCCIRLSKTHVHRDLLKSYYQQHQPSCKIHAVVFKTVRKRRICADPAEVWTKTSMAYLDGKNWQIHKANLLQKNSQKRLS